MDEVRLNLNTINESSVWLVSPTTVRRLCSWGLWEMMVMMVPHASGDNLSPLSTNNNQLHPLSRMFRPLLMVGVLLMVVIAVTAKDGTAERKLNIDPALRKALLRALRHLKERQEEEKQEQLLGDANTTEENFATTILDELLEESTVADSDARVRDTSAVDYHTFVANAQEDDRDTIEGEVEQRDTGAVTVGSSDANEIIKTIIIAKPKATLTAPKLESENEIVPPVDQGAVSTTEAPLPVTSSTTQQAPISTTTGIPVPTTPAPTHNEDGENIEQVKSEDVKIFQAPLVAAFTVQQDQLGVPRNVIPLLQTPPKQKSPGATDFKPSPVILPPFNLFPVLPPLLIGPSPFDQQQLPPLQQRNRVFRQEPVTGNFGLNVGPPQQAPFRPSQPLAFNGQPTAPLSDSQNLQNLLFQSGITSRSAEDFNIITKVLALNHGIPQASSQRMFAKLSPDQQRQLLFRKRIRTGHSATSSCEVPDGGRNTTDTALPSSAKLTSDGQDLLDALARFSYFERWSDEQRRDCCHRAQIRRFEPDQTVFVEGQAPVNYAHFMLSGECGLLQCLKLHWRRDRRTGAKRYRLSRAQPTEDEITRFHRRRQQAMDTTQTEEYPASIRHIPANERRKATKVEYHFVDIATYSRGSVFGIGEHMVDRAVFARTHVQCLLIPRYWLLEKPQNRGNIWNRIRIFLEQRQPSRDRLFRWFLNELLWHRYRKQLVDDFLLVHAPRHLPRLIDVPLVCRIEECDVPNETD
uniref:Cyclic nucleotide-binding domain-containing protein n=1 Tax=Anopheles culicifacies TaxID=139723 RepID=A0A182MJT1_9DIPT